MKFRLKVNMWENEDRLRNNLEKVCTMNWLLFALVALGMAFARYWWLTSVFILFAIPNLLIVLSKWKYDKVKSKEKLDGIVRDNKKTF